MECMCFTFRFIDIMDQRNDDEVCSSCGDLNYNFTAFVIKFMELFNDKKKCVTEILIYRRNSSVQLDMVEKP